MMQSCVCVCVCRVFTGRAKAAGKASPIAKAGSSQRPVIDGASDSDNEGGDMGSQESEGGEGESESDKENAGRDTNRGAVQQARVGAKAGGKGHGSAGQGKKDKDRRKSLAGACCCTLCVVPCGLSTHREVPNALVGLDVSSTLCAQSLCVCVCCVCMCVCVCCRRRATGGRAWRASQLPCAHQAPSVLAKRAQGVRTQPPHHAYRGGRGDTHTQHGLARSVNRPRGEEEDACAHTRCAARQGW